MKKDLSDITVIMDRSGSMGSCQREAEDGINNFVQEQRSGVGEVRFSLVQFDDVYEFVHRGLPIATVPKIILLPRGGTALLDAVGRAVVETGERLNATPEDQRPGLVIMVIATDGYENQSKEFTKARIKEMIEHQQTVYGWQFIFLGANQDAFAEARGMGVADAGAANYSPRKSPQAYRGTSENVKRMRSAAASGQSVRNAFTEEERKSMAE